MWPRTGVSTIGTMLNEGTAGRMDYHLTQHATDALAKRQIPLAWVEQVLSNPDWTEPDAIDGELEHRLGRISDFQDRVLRVIVNLQVTPLRVVTVYFDRRSSNL